MHMLWVGAVAGRLKSDYRYSSGLVYNTFPIPDLSQGAKEGLSACAFTLLAAREKYPGLTLAELYDPDEMPPVLREAHQQLDATVNSLYGEERIDSDDARLAMLFSMYSNMVATQSDPKLDLDGD